MAEGKEIINNISKPYSIYYITEHKFEQLKKELSVKFNFNNVDLLNLFETIDKYL